MLYPLIFLWPFRALMEKTKENENVCWNLKPLQMRRAAWVRKNVGSRDRVMTVESTLIPHRAGRLITMWCWLLGCGPHWVAESGNTATTEYLLPVCFIHLRSWIKVAASLVGEFLDLWRGGENSHFAYMWDCCEDSREVIDLKKHFQGENHNTNFKYYQRHWETSGVVLNVYFIHLNCGKEAPADDWTLKRVSGVVFVFCPICCLEGYDFHITSCVFPVL